MLNFHKEEKTIIEILFNYENSRYNSSNSNNFRNFNNFEWCTNVNCIYAPN